MMHPIFPARSRSGFLLLEVMLGIAVFGLFLAAVGLTILHGQENTVIGGDRVRATYAAERALEAAKNIRDEGFSSLAAGTHGVAVGPSKKWILNGTQSVFSGGYITSLSVSSLASDWAGLSASVKWKHGHTRSGSVMLWAELTDWRTSRAAGDWSSVALDGSYVDDGIPLFNSAAVRGNYAYVTSDTSSGGAGLYVFDISSTTAPARVASSFTLGAAGYGVLARGDTLYVVTSDPSQEIRAYDISSPTTFSDANLRASHNLSGSSLGISLSMQRSLLLAGAMQDATYRELYSFDISDPDAIVPRDSLEAGASVNAIAVSATGAFLATDDAAAEWKNVAVSSTGALASVAASAVNLTGSEAVRSVALAGTSALLGRQKGSIQEMTLLNTSGVTGPWYHEGSGSLVGVGMDPARCYAFLAADSTPKALQVVNLRDTSLPELATYTSASGPARGLFYDMVRDRVYVLTRRAFVIFRPGSSTSVCS